MVGAIATPGPTYLMASASFSACDDAPGEPRVETGGLLGQVGRRAALLRGVFPASIDMDKLGRAHAAMLLFDKCISEGKNELLARKLFAALFRGA